MRSGRMLWLGGLLLLVVVPLVWSAGVVHGSAPTHWSQARWDSAGLAPDPATTPEPVVQVYAARAWGWKGIFAVHSWIIMKRADAPAFERYEVVGWGVGRGAPAIRKDMRTIDGYWAGNRPWVLVDRRGPEVEALIDRLEAAIASYPYPTSTAPGPGRTRTPSSPSSAGRCPSSASSMPPTAIGKDYLDNGSLLARTPSGSGVQAVAARPARALDRARRRPGGQSARA